VINNDLYDLIMQHMNMALTLTILWHCWVAFILSMIYWEFRIHNARAEQADYRDLFKKRDD
jgi:hypothetical protein